MFLDHLGSSDLVTIQRTVTFESSSVSSNTINSTQISFSYTFLLFHNHKTKIKVIEVWLSQLSLYLGDIWHRDKTGKIENEPKNLNNYWNMSIHIYSQIEQKLGENDDAKQRATSVTLQLTHSCLGHY